MRTKEGDWSTWKWVKMPYTLYITCHCAMSLFTRCKSMCKERHSRIVSESRAFEHQMSSRTKTMSLCSSYHLRRFIQNGEWFIHRSCHWSWILSSSYMWVLLSRCVCVIVWMRRTHVSSHRSIQFGLHFYVLGNTLSNASYGVNGTDIHTHTHTRTKQRMRTSLPLCCFVFLQQAVFSVENWMNSDVLRLKEKNCEIHL